VIEAIKKINWFRIHDRHMENREVEVVDREIAGYVFLKIGCSAIEPIIASINNSNNSEFRKYAIQALSYFRDERIVDTLIDRMKDPDVFTGVVAAYALKNFPNKKVIDALISTFSYNSGNVIDEVCKTLEFIGEPAIDSLIAALDDERYKRYCIRVITAIRGSSDQTNEVNSSLNIKPQKRIEQENQIIPQLIKSIKRSNPNYREEAAISLVKLADSSINLLLSYLDVPDPFVQTAVMMALAKLANPETIEPLINKMRDNNWKIRSLAAFVLSRIGNPSVKRLIESLNDSDWKVRSGAADALGYMHDKQALEPLSKLCTDSDLYVRISAVNAKKIIESYLKSESDEYTRN